MPTTVPTPDILGERQSGHPGILRTRNDSDFRSAMAIAELVKSTLGPKGMCKELMKKNPQTEPAKMNGDDLDDNADLIDENGALALTLEDGGDALDCGVCHLPLKPPIFQCIDGHVMCTLCRRSKLEATGNAECHVCGEEIDEDDTRCHAMERLVESIRVPCPNAAHGCTARPTYYDRSSHHRVCLHKRYSCYGHGCGFVGSAGALLDHVASVHTDNNEVMKKFWKHDLGLLMNKLKLVTTVDDPRDTERSS